MDGTMADQFVIWWSHFLLILLRVASIFTLTPIFGRNNLPMMARVGLAGGVSLILIQFYPAPATYMFNTLWGFGLACILEMLVGLALGFVTIIFINLVYTAGQIIDTSAGFGMVQVFDIQTSTQVPVVGGLFNIAILMCFLATNGHVRLIETIARSFEIIPVGHVRFGPELAMIILDAFVRSFAIAINIALPVIASGLLTEVSMGIIVRTAPQMNVFMVGIPLKLIVGLLMLILIVPTFVSATQNIFDSMFGYMDQMLKGMMPV